MIGPTKEDNELFEEILKDITIFSPIFTKDINKYLESLLNLEISALSKSNISDKEMESLKRLDVYRKLVYYNILLRSKKLVDTNSEKYALNDAFDSFFIDLNNGDCQHKDKLFLLGRNLEYESFVKLYKKENISFDDYMKKYDDYKVELRKNIEDECYYKGINCLKNDYKVYRLHSELNKLNARKDEEWHTMYEKEMFIAREQRSYLRLFLEDSKLTEDDFITNEENNLVREGKVYRLTIERL